MMTVIMHNIIIILKKKLLGSAEKKENIKMFFIELKNSNNKFLVPFIHGNDNKFLLRLRVLKFMVNITVFCWRCYYCCFLHGKDQRENSNYKNKHAGALHEQERTHCSNDKSPINCNTH